MNLIATKKVMNLKNIIFSSIFLLSYLSITSSLTVECVYYDNGDWWVLKDFYYCSANSHLSIESPDSAAIDSVTGEHIGNFTLDDVVGFEADNLTIHYFPKGLEKIFKNLKMIDINHGRMKEIHQSDLKPFPKLTCLEIYENDFEVLEEGLFDYNPNLEMIWLSNNKIFHIGLNVFEHLTKLTYLSLDYNRCISKYTKDNATAVAEIVKYAKRNCQDVVYLRKTYPTFMKNFDKIQSDLDSLKQIEANIEKKVASQSSQIDKVQSDLENLKLMETNMERQVDERMEHNETWQTLLWIIFGMLMGFGGFVVYKKIFQRHSASTARVSFENQQFI